MNRVTLAIIAFFGTALLLYWQVQSKKSNDTVTFDVSLRPDYIADDLRSVDYNELGLVSSRVTATHMEHFDETNMTYFTQPIYLIYPDGGQAKWRLQSTMGTLNKKSGKVVLENNVIIDSISPDEPIQTMKTSYLELDLNTMVMTSDREVYITGNDFTIQGVGLFGDLNAQKIQLLSKVKGIYEVD
ncbi:putative Lipopolysaccharide export system protein LptC [Shewanella benthica]|uniref:Lipopolysaccharide export system protein LptC n=1 Tax=Shewanella benthica TaxID=43661 RepID=A0A330LXN4_9GAMM|nr:LPS export ABC transporter periplasmic protein LptC [Shewanella benthica]SQH75046.1 putative Lipopolysaccharide export system protein LptC [Shewanella benthica]